MKKSLFVVVLFYMTTCLAPATAEAQMAGDATGDGVVDASDIVCEINYLFRSGAFLGCFECGDANADCIVNAGDVVCLITYLFRQGPEPQFPECGWSEPVNLGPPINSYAGDGPFRMSLDGRMAAVVSNRAGTYGNDDIWYTYWDSTAGNWSELLNCGPNVNWSPDDASPSFSPDGKKLYCRLFGRPGGSGDWDVWVSPWDTLNGQWGPIQNPGPAINDPGAGDPFLSPDGTKLYFRFSGIGFSEWNDTAWSDRVYLGPNVNAGFFEGGPTVTADDRTLYFHRWNDSWYICVSRWTGTEWGPAEELGPPVNSAGSERSPYITPDGSRLYFVAGRPGGLGSGDVWVSQRVPILAGTTSVNKELSSDTQTKQRSKSK